jgi:hypothetical protein
MVRRLPEAMAGFAVVSDSAACSYTITARRDGSRPRLGPVLGIVHSSRCDRGARRCTNDSVYVLQSANEPDTLAHSLALY